MLDYQCLQAFDVFVSYADVCSVNFQARTSIFYKDDNDNDDKDDNNTDDDYIYNSVNSHFFMSKKNHTMVLVSIFNHVGM